MNAIVCNRIRFRRCGDIRRERRHGAFVDLTVDGGRRNQTFGVKDAGHHQADVDAVGCEFQTQGVECCP
jgi:hypothetical protein